MCWLFLSFFITMPLLFPPTYKFKYFFSFRNLIVGGLLVILVYDVAYSSHNHVPSFLLSFFCYSYDPSNLNKSEDVMSLNEYSHTPKENLPIPSRVGIKKWNYDAITNIEKTLLLDGLQMLYCLIRYSLKHYCNALNYIDNIN